MILNPTVSTVILCKNIDLNFHRPHKLFPFRDVTSHRACKSQLGLRPARNNCVSRPTCLRQRAFGGTKCSRATLSQKVYIFLASTFSPSVKPQRILGWRYILSSLHLDGCRKFELRLNKQHTPRANTPNKHYSPVTPCRMTIALN